MITWRSFGFCLLTIGLFLICVGVYSMRAERIHLRGEVARLQLELDKPDPASCACLNETKIQKACAAGVAGAIDQAVESGQALEMVAVLTRLAAER